MKNDPYIIKPDAFLNCCKAFTETIQLENEICAGQLKALIGQVIYAMEELIKLCKEIRTGDPFSLTPAAAQMHIALRQEADMVFKKMNGQTASSQPYGKTAIKGSDDLEILFDYVVNNISLSYEHAVNAQREVIPVMQSAVSISINSIFAAIQHMLPPTSTLKNE